MLSDVRSNHTDVVLTDENTEPADSFMAKELGFIKARCGYCKANLSLHDGVVTCLNACYLSTGAYRQMQAGLMEAKTRIEAREHKTK